MTASTMIAQNRLAPSGKLKATRTAGTSTIMPIRPYTTEGMPASRSTAGRTMDTSRGEATLDRNTAVIKPIGTPMRMAPQVP